jgi:hypothetical protein
MGNKDTIRFLLIRMNDLGLQSQNYEQIHCFF